MPERNKGSVFGSGDYEIDLTRREVRVSGAVVPVGARAFGIIETLVQSAGRLVTKDELMSRVWPGAIVGDGTLQVHISAIRRALGPHRSMLKTDSGRGYRLIGDWTARRRDAATPLVGPSRIRVDSETPVTNFPAAATPLIGRAVALGRLRDLVSAYRLVTLTGPGGIGKTSLALEVARGVVGEFADGGWLIELASLSEPALLPSTAAHELRIGLVAEQISAELVARGIGARNVLLVLDNCEHLIGAAAEFVEMVMRLCPNVTILATSREILRIDGEYVYRVPPLDAPAPAQHNPRQILEHSAVELFIARATALGSEFPRHAENLPTIATICRQLDGIPLAIEFAAARAAILGLDQVALSLRDRFARLTNGRRTAVPRHRTLRALLDWSYELLSEPERLLLRRLAIFAGGFTDDAVAAVMDDTGRDRSAVMDGIANLVTKSLVTQDNRGAADRWYLLETVRAYAFEKLAKHDHADAVARLQARHYRDRFAPREPGLSMRLSDQDLVSRVREIDNVRAALDWCFSPAGDIDIGRDLTASYALVWLHRALNNECRERCDQALAGLEPVGGQNTRRRMLLQIALATALYAAEGQSEHAKTLAAEASEFAEILADVDTLVWAVATLFSLNVNRRDYGAARMDAEQLQHIADRVGDPAMVSVANRRMGYLQLMGGGFREAQRSFEHALRFRFAPDDRQPAFLSFPLHHPSTTRTMLAEVLWLRGFAERALNEDRPNLHEPHPMDHQLALCRLVTFGTCRIAIMTGDLATADREIAGLIELSTRLDATFWQTTGRLLEARLMVERGAFAEALTMLRGAFGVDGQTRHHFYDHEVRSTLAEALAGLGQFNEALGVLDEAITSASRPDGLTWYLAELLRIKGEILLQQATEGSMLAAEDCFSQAGAMAREQGALFWELRIALSLARLRVTQRRENEAREILLPVYEQFTEGFATKDLRAARAMLDALPGRAR